MYLRKQTITIVVSVGLLVSWVEVSVAQITEWVQEDQLTTVKMTITPADEPVPALKHQLVSRPHQMRNGNAATHYLRAYPEGGVEKHIDHWKKEQGEDTYDWHSPEYFLLDQLPKEAKQMAEDFDTETKSYFEPASRCRTADWGHDLSGMSGIEIISFLLPEVQAARSISRVLALRTRIALSEERFDDAINLMRINYKLGQDVNQSPFLVSSLVGIAITGITDQSLLEYVAQPGAPNLYWALAEMPNPPISVREALRQEMHLAKRLFPVLELPKENSLAYAEWNARWNQFDQLAEMQSFVGGNNTSLQVAKSFIGVGTGLLGYSHAKKRLIEVGYAMEDVEKMPVGQVLAIYSSYAYDRVANEIEKRYYIPFHLRDFYKDDPWEGVEFFGDNPDREIVPVASLLLPAVNACVRAEARATRNHTVLQVIEAIRMHAAENDGKLPEKLSDITCVIVPRNPATDNSFAYRLDGSTAILELPKSDGFNHAWRYEIQVAQ